MKLSAIISTVASTSIFLCLLKIIYIQLFENFFTFLTVNIFYAVFNSIERELIITNFYQISKY